MISYVCLACQLVSCAIVALGQNAWVPWCGPLAASFGFALHWKTLDSLSKKGASRVSFCWFLVISAFQLSWMTDTKYQGVYILFVYLFVVVVCALQFSFLTRKIRDVGGLKVLSVLGLCSLWTLMEWMRLHFLCGYAFNFVGLSLSCHLFSLQMASFFGVLGLTFFAILTNLIGLKFLRSPRSTSFLFGWALAIFLPYIMGWAHVRYQDYEKAKEGGQEYNVLLMQTGLLPSQKYKIRGKEKDFVHPIDQWTFVLEKIKERKNEKIDLVVLPEAAFPYGFDLYLYDIDLVQRVLTKVFGEKILHSLPPSIIPYVQEKSGVLRASNAYWVQTLANLLQTEVVVGLDIEKEEKNYNAAFFFVPGGEPKRYDKRVLLPGAEYIPFEALRSFSQKYGIDNFFTPGKQAQVFGCNKIAPCICYDELFPSLMREGKKEGAELFVNLTNDGWFSYSRLSKQHFTHALLRTVENGVPLVRSCSIGVTGAVDSLGRVIDKLEEKERGSLLIKVPKYHYRTFFSLFGQSPFLILCGIFLLIGFFQKPFLARRASFL